MFKKRTSSCRVSEVIRVVDRNKRGTDDYTQVYRHDMEPSTEWEVTGRVNLSLFVFLLGGCIVLK